MNVEMSQVKPDELVENDVVADAAMAILVESDSLNDWFVEQCRAGNLA